MIIINIIIIITVELQYAVDNTAQRYWIHTGSRDPATSL